MRTRTISWIISLLLDVVLTINPTNYHITFNPGVDEVKLIIWSDSADDTPYLAIQSVPVEKTFIEVDIVRQYLPPGSYILQPQTVRWDGCPTRCELIPVETGKTTIIHIPGKKPEDQDPNQ